ncbi:MAG: hypothetical protein HN576_12140 [Bacteriovoracaceae bacterium]|jgi:hypothetical protein|nr:hypothetical protein [Bacteriovoracaceae bacterium]
MKKILFLSFIIMLLGGIITLQDQIDSLISDSQIIEEDSWTTYEKKEDKLVQSPSTSKELKKIGAEQTKKKSLIPKRSLSSVQMKPKNYKTYQGRRIIGHIKKDMNDINFINKVEKTWKDKLSEKLLQHRDRQAKLFIKSENSVIKIQNGSARYLEQVNITFLFKGDDSNSFKAFVDSETGEILNTWNRSIHDKVNVKAIKFTPDGTL